MRKCINEKKNLYQKWFIYKELNDRGMNSVIKRIVTKERKRNALQLLIKT